MRHRHQIRCVYCLLALYVPILWHWPVNNIVFDLWHMFPSLRLMIHVSAMDGKTQIHPQPLVWTSNSKQPAWASSAAAVDMPWVQITAVPHSSTPFYQIGLESKCLEFDFTADHVSHLENVSEDEINRLLGMVVDVENLFMSVHKEEDTDTKQVYFYLFKVGPWIFYHSGYFSRSYFVII